jgi:hypothetical protein
VHDITVNDLEHVTALAEAEHAFQMTEEAFRRFYNQTSRAVWMYLARMTGDSRMADDLLQEDVLPLPALHHHVRQRRSSASLSVPHRHESGSRSTATAAAARPPRRKTRSTSIERAIMATASSRTSTSRARWSS